MRSRYRNDAVPREAAIFRPVTRTGDYSDVAVVDADGRIIPWQRVARLDGTEMARTMSEIVDRLYRLYTFLRNLEEPELAALRDHRRDETSEWPRPKEDSGCSGAPVNTSLVFRQAANQHQ